MKNLNKTPKIGIYGWSGTGKTTYISMLHYLFSQNIFSSIYNSTILDYNGNLNHTLQEQIKIFLKYDDWDSVNNEIKGSIHTSNLVFEIETKKGSKRFEIQDYRGEKIADKESDDFYDDFLGCDSLLLFLDIERFEEKVKGENTDRLSEFKNLLFKMMN